MNEASRSILYLVVEGLPDPQRPKLTSRAGEEIFVLTESNGAEALSKIFASDAVSVWGEVAQKIIPLS